MKSMKILLLGEYSNVHCTLAKGLKELGHQVTVASNGDFWKNYPRDVNLARRPGKAGGIALLLKLWSLAPKLRGYDVVQLINPMFVELKAERIFPLYHFLRTHNKKVVMGAFGMDYYWVKTCCDEKPLRYSDFNIGQTLRQNKDALKERKDWLGTAKQRLNEMMAHDCDAIITGLYEYWICYKDAFPQKTTFIPLPIDRPEQRKDTFATPQKVKVFIGISKSRSEYKGTDIMLRAAQALRKKYPNQMELRTVEGLPFEEYRQVMEGSDVLLDQLYSYTPSMNTLLAMSKGIVCVGGGEPENYEIIQESTLRPIINVQPTYESVYEELERLILNPQMLSRLKRESMEYVRRHHDYLTVAKRYEQLYNQLLK